MKDYNKLMSYGCGIVKKKDNFGGDLYFIPRAVRGRNKTRCFNELIKKGWKVCQNDNYITDGEFYGHNNVSIGIIFE